MASLALEKMGSGGRLDLWADDPATRQDLPAWCAEFGCRVLGIVEGKKGFRIRIQKIK
ncbi:MAG: sulfurtransferase TusA family protein [Elusimicrobia bacterium]|nr:sulfurtransferase TusA family protein [Elusimicrobiota bacterium]